MLKFFTWSLTEGSVDKKIVEVVVDLFSPTNGLLNASINGTWIYYSWEDTLIYAVDLSQYLVKKDDMTGDIFFYKCDDTLDPRKEKDEPHKGWQNDIIKPKRPKVTKVPIKL